jgi:hypothetical protein
MSEEQSTVPTKDDLMLNALLPYADKVKVSNKTDVQIVYATRKTKVVFLFLPQWRPTFMPYNLARLSSVTKAAGYETHVFDVNVEMYQESKNWDLGWDPFDPAYMMRWLNPSYEESLEPVVKPILQKYVDKVVELNPSVVGYTLYECNRECVKWVNKELKKRLPNLISVLGGPICHRHDPCMGEGFDYIVSGEGEELILQLLEEVEQNGRPSFTKTLVQGYNQRINLDTLPLPDYSHFDPNLYIMPNGATTELSRGCTAKCVFCHETHFWKYRNRSASSLMQELKYLSDKGVNYIWFLDSLVNGNLKELRNFCQDIQAFGINLHWTGYARCDGRMDLEFFKDLKASGCESLCIGLEAGSNKVLATMAKGITTDEVLQNLKDATTVGINMTVMIIPGFVNETPQEVLETFTTLWKIRNCNLNYISVGQFGLVITEESILGHMREDYGILHHSYGTNWITKNFDNSKVHRLIRCKIYNIFLSQMINDRNFTYTNRMSVDKTYQIQYENPSLQNEIGYEEFDYNIIKPNTGNGLADTVVNEIWPLLRILYKTRGAFKIDINFEEHEDTREFSMFVGCPYNARYVFEIDNNGNWKADFKFDYKQPENYWIHALHNPDTVGESNVAKRIQVFTKKAKFPKKTLDEIYQDYIDNYKDIDLSFNYHYVGEGKW